MVLFSYAVLWIWPSNSYCYLLFNLSAFYLNTDIRKIYGFFIGVYSSTLLGVAAGIIIYFLILKRIYCFKILYLFIVIFLLLFFVIFP